MTSTYVLVLTKSRASPDPADPVSTYSQQRQLLALVLRQTDPLVYSAITIQSLQSIVDDMRARLCYERTSFEVPIGRIALQLCGYVIVFRLLINELL